MIELKKKHIHINRRRAGTACQITLDDDFNVPDAMDDVEELILENGEIQMDAVKNLGERARLEGKLAFRVLYRRPDGQLMTLGGSLPFAEEVQAAGLAEGDELRADGVLDDLNVSLIHSRKLGVKALVTFRLRAEAIEDAQAAYDAEYDGQVEVKKREILTAALAVHRKDTFRVREVLTLPANRPDIDTLLWQELRLLGVETKPLDGKIQIEGELAVFAVYAGEDGQTPVLCVEESIPFSGEVELTESSEGMIPFITVRLLHKELEARPDADGEMRELAVDAVMELDIRLYEEQPTEILSDLYALDREVIPETDEVCLDQIAARNQVKCRIQEKVSLPAGKRVLQICHSGGEVKAEEVQLRDDGLHIDGILEVQVLYMTADDASPLGAVTELLPFQAVVEARELTEDCTWRMDPGLEQLSAVMAGGDGLEIRAAATFNVLIFRPVCEQVILDVREEPLDMERMKRMPGMVGYFVQPGDTLWKLARRFHTSAAAIMETNRLEDERIREGDKLLLIKEMAGSGRSAG